MLRAMGRAIFAAIVCGLPCAVHAQAERTSDPGKVIEAISPSLVRVEYTLRYDKGELPPEDSAPSWRPPGDARAPTGRPWDSWEEVIREERPAVRGGVLIAPTRVFTGDPMVHPRFIASIKVRAGFGAGAEAVDATPTAYPVSGGGWMLELSKPLASGKPVPFDPKGEARWAIRSGERDGVWTALATSVPSDVMRTAEGRRFTPITPETLIVSDAGVGVGIAGAPSLPADGSWKVAPGDWRSLSAAEMKAATDRLDKSAASSLLRVRVDFRSPRNQSDSGRGMYDYYGGADGSDLTEWNGVGALVDAKTLLVLAELKPKVTARLERVRVFDSAGVAHEAKFSATLKDWGAFTATLAEPMSGALAFSGKGVTEYRDQLLLRARVEVRGETRSAYLWHDRVTQFEVRHHGRVFPIADTGVTGYGQYADRTAVHALFDLDGALVALPMTVREKVTVSRGPDGAETMMVPAAIIAAAVRAAPADIDPENRPLSEDEENRIAWMGVELQSLDEDLARANNVSDLTSNGSTGAIVTFVFDGSPAAKAGIVAGDVLLRLHVDGQPKPLDVTADDYDSGRMAQFWQYLDQIPADYFDRIPTPWPNAETDLMRSLTDLGFGTPVRAEVFRGGKVIDAAFKVEQGPAHYGAAKRFQSEPLGITVRDLTYEVRQYFRLKPSDSGVIVSKIEKGGKAAVAGIKPFEIVTSINDAPVSSVAEAEKALAQSGELRLAIKRMTKGRIVKIKNDGEAPAVEDETPKDAEGTK